MFKRLAAASLLSVGAGLLSAALVPKLSLEEMTGASDLIVHVRVGDSFAAWDPQRLFIWTHYKLEVLEVWKGNVDGPLVVSEPGGALDGISMAFSGALRYKPGEEVILFLYRTPIGYWRARGLSQGKVAVESRNGRLIISRDGIPVGQFKSRVQRLSEVR
jgi:hypothetical protein